MYQPRPLHQPYKLRKITGECERSYFERRSIILINHEYIYLYQQKMICFSLNFNHHRYFLLSNGSLLITSLTINDTGRYKYVEVRTALTLFWLNFCLFFLRKKRCDALNEYIPKKSQRTAWVMLKVEEPADPSIKHFGLQPPLQEQNLFVPTHDILRLHCASYSEKVSDFSLFFLRSWCLVSKYKQKIYVKN